MQLEMPDSQIMLVAIKHAVAKVEFKEMEHCLQVHMFQHNLPQETNRQKVEELVSYLRSKMRKGDLGASHLSRN
eukprot:1064899-Prorocentrum_lima.AAC.1